MAKEPEFLAHQEWLGYVQPVGLVVSIPALLSAQAHVNRNIAPDHQRFLGCLPVDKHDQLLPEIRDFPEFTRTVLGWEQEDMVAAPDTLEVTLPVFQETLRPTYAVREFEQHDGPPRWLLLVKELPMGTDFDEVFAKDDRHWQATPHAKFERLLRETEVPIGLLINGKAIRLVYAPRGESSGYLTFVIDEMATVAGRPIFAAMHMLLSADRLFSLPEKQRLPAILADSRKYQNVVSTKLAQQVLAALYELLRGFQGADDQRKGELLREVLAADPDHVYRGLLTVLMRLVFVLYAEDRGLLSNDSVYVNYYSVSGLFERLRADAGRYPDTMDQRYGAWAQLLTLFRVIFDGAYHGNFQIPPRKGYLFDPDRYNFLEGRSWKQSRRPDETADVPRISDGVIFRVLNNLLILDGERLSYRTLDVEQIGSVYEAIMGFNLDVADGPSIAVKPTKRHGAPSTINLEKLLAAKPMARTKWLQDHTEQKITGNAASDLKQAESLEDVLAALDKKIARAVTPNVVSNGAMILQPSEERRRSGSHYTPRSLTEPIVRTTLEPILKQLVDPSADLPAVYEPTREDEKRFIKGELAERVRLSQKAFEAANLAREVGTPHPTQILDLKICDPAMGSGAFLVEACRQLGDELIKAWYAHDLLPRDIPPDEDEVLYARRLVAQRCLYGVDKNDMAVDLAKLSLWLVTLAKDHPFTFLDHALRHGDSLVGLTRRQIIGFHWEPKKQQKFGEDLIQQRLDKATEARAKILNAPENVPYLLQQQKLAEADSALSVVRLTGDACVSAFFAGSKKKEREERCEELFASVSDWYASGHDINKRGPIAAAAASLRCGERPIPSFHWEIEFPEVFSRENGGFDAFVGNPPFLGGVRVSANLGDCYRDWLLAIHADSHGNSDLVAHFFRMAFRKTGKRGCMGLLATNTIAQGDTRHTGLRYMCTHKGIIFSAKRRYYWPGEAAVVVSIVWIAKGIEPERKSLDGREVSMITAFLFHAGGHENPSKLRERSKQSFKGVVVLGMGFTFDDTDSTGLASSTAEMEKLIGDNPKNSERVFPFIGGWELNNSPTHAHTRHIINFERLEETEAAQWPDLLSIVRQKVKPGRDRDKRDVRRKYWWRLGEPAPALFEAVSGLNRVLVHALTGKHMEAFTFLDGAKRYVYDQSVIVLSHSSFAVFAILSSRLHAFWAQFFTSSMKDDLRYNPSDCFETFAFPREWESNDEIHRIGQAYFDFRANLMVRNGEGLTKTYNRFHNPHEKSLEILHLRELHAAMDRAVLETYGWDDLAQTARCEFLLDYEEEDDENDSGRKSKKKKPWRLRWPDDFRDEVLARLLELNEQRHKEELLAGEAAVANDENKSQRRFRRVTGVVQNDSTQTELF